MRPLDENTFDQALADASGLVLVDFWAPWCAPCRVVTPILENLELQYAQEVDFYQVNVQEVPLLMQAFRLQSIPSVLLLKPNKDQGDEDQGGARVLDAIIGARPAQQYINLLERHLRPKPGIVHQLKGLFKRH